MPAYVTVNDDRWQFIAGNKYWVIGAIRFSGTYVTGGIPLLFQDQRSPKPVSAGTVKASRAPWFGGIMSDASGNQYVYLTPSQVNNIDPPNTTGTTQPPPDVNNGLLKVFSGGAELAAGAALSGVVTGLFIFQGME